MQHLTQYAVTYQGEVIQGHTWTEKSEALAYITQGIAAGNAPEAYGLAHRRVILGDWAPTTNSHRA